MASPSLAVRGAIPVNNAEELDPGKVSAQATEVELHPQPLKARAEVDDRVGGDGLGCQTAGVRVIVRPQEVCSFCKVPPPRFTAAEAFVALRLLSCSVPPVFTLSAVEPAMLPVMIKVPALTVVVLRVGFERGEVQSSPCPSAPNTLSR